VDTVRPGTPFEHADLFWALRGGGGNFGIVTSFRFRAHPLTHVVEGRLTYDLVQAPAVMRAYRAFAPSAPDELTAVLSVTARERRPALSLHIVFAGDAASAAPILRTLRGFVKAQTDTIAPVSYLKFKRANPGTLPGLPSTVRAGFLPDLSDEVIDALSGVAAGMPPTVLLAPEEGRIPWIVAKWRLD